MAKLKEIEIGWEKPRRKGVTALARRLGYSKVYVSQVLAGKLKPGAPLAAKLKRLGIEVEVAARRLGCTQANVSMVVRGVRKSRSLLERMRKMNIRVEA